MSEHTPLYKGELDEGARELYLALYIDDAHYADVYIGDKDQDDIDLWRDIANLWLAAPALLAACEAEEAIEDHIRMCPTCQVDRHQCGARTDLFLEARRLRQAAIAQAKGE